MFYWATKILALLSVMALLMGLAAQTTTLMGDVRSLTQIPTDRDPPYGLMLAVKKTKGPGKEIKCQAYAWGTDFNQRPGAIFHAGFYHGISLLGLLAMVVHQGLRGLIPATLPTLFKFVPALQGQWGLGGSGSVMVYTGFQITSYSVGKLHLITAAVLIIVGLLNICACFFPLIVSANAPPPAPSGGGMGGGGFGPDPFGGNDMYGGAPPGMDDMGGPPMGGPGPPGASAPDPYADPYGEAAGGKGEGVGAGSAPPGAIDRPVKDDDDDDEDGKMVYDPRTGLWSTRGKGVPANPMMGGMLPGMPMGYGMYGQPMMNPYGGYMPGAGLGQQEDPRSSKDIKKAIKKQARKGLERMKRKEEEEGECGSESSDDDDRESRRSARRRWREAARRAREDEERQRAFERHVREEEKRQQMIARGIAMQDARQRAAQEVAEEDARMRNYEEMIDNQREMAMTDAQRERFQSELDDMREQQQLLMARRRAEMDAAERERQDAVLYRQPQTQGNYYQPQWSGNTAAQYYHGQRRPSRSSQTPSLPPYQPAAYGAGMQGGQNGQLPLKYPGQPSAPPSYAGSRYRQQAIHAYPPQAYHQQQYAGADYQGYHPDDQEEFDFDDDITEIQSVRSETSSQRRLVRQRMDEERERVLITQALEKQYKYPHAPAYDEMDIVDDYRSGRSAGSSSRSRRPGWRR